MIFVDTNYFVRFLLQDNQKQYRAAKRLFADGARGKLVLTTSVIVIFEIYWVLKSYYNKTKPELIKTLQKLLEMNFIVFENYDILQEMLNLFSTTTLSLEDCYHLAFAKSHNIKEFKTFDIKLTKEFHRSRA